MNRNTQVIAKKSRRQNRQRFPYDARDLAHRVAVLGEAAILKMPAPLALVGIMGGLLKFAHRVMKREDIVDWLDRIKEDIKRA